MPVKFRFVGSGDSFGSGGRFQACILVDGPGTRFAIDFGCSSLIAPAQQGIHHNSIDAVLLTHLHGDHCGGVPFLLMDAMLAAKLRVKSGRPVEPAMLANIPLLMPTREALSGGPSSRCLLAPSASPARPSPRAA